MRFTPLPNLGRPMPWPKNRGRQLAKELKQATEKHLLTTKLNDGL